MFLHRTQRSGVRAWRLALAAVLLAPGAAASDLALTVRSAGQGTLVVAPGESVTYQVLGELSDAANEGLALFCFDLAFSGGTLQTAEAPVSGPLTEFAAPRGVTNPQGFGGTAQGGRLLQVGGAQNTIRNIFAPIPVGSVVTGVASPGSPAVLVQGQLTAPGAPGVYTLEVSNGIANVIRAGEDGSGPFWAVDAAGIGALTPLTIEVLDCAPTTYCVGKQNSQGCVPSIGSTGTATLSGPDDFVVTCDDVINQQMGLLFLGRQPAAVPFMGGTLCVSQVILRGALQASGGDPLPAENCTGTFAFPVTQQVMTQFPLAFAPGQQVYGQVWYRDTNHPDGFGIGFSDALEFTVCP